jgi:hypothetical protein
VLKLTSEGGLGIRSLWQLRVRKQCLGRNRSIGGRTRQVSPGWHESLLGQSSETLLFDET